MTPDTVLKWIKSGRLAAGRTPGGHYRIRPKDLRVFRSGGPARAHRFCWEYREKVGGSDVECKDCIVYRARAHRCYELFRNDENGSEPDGACNGRCEDCDYYRLVLHQTRNVVVYAGDPALREALEGESRGAPFNLAVVDSEYALSSLVETFRPDFVLIDREDDETEAGRLARLLLEDDRLSLVRILLAIDPGPGPRECDRRVFAYIERPITIDRIENCISDIQKAARPDGRGSRKSAPRREGRRGREDRP